MNKYYTSIILILTVLCCGTLTSQQVQKNFINYQGVARNVDNNLMAGEAITIEVALKFGNVNATSLYTESHSVLTDANGVFNVAIGNGSSITGDYNTLPWGGLAAFVTVSINGEVAGTTEMMAVPFAMSARHVTGLSGNDIQYDNSSSGLTAITTQEAIDELIEGSVDADADPSNELQVLSYDALTSELSLSDGNSIIIPTGGSDADADPTNELQTIGFDAGSNKITLTDGGEITIPTGGADADADPENEFQTLNFDPITNELSLSNGNTITIPSGGTDADADPENEIDVTRRRGLLIGNDGLVDGLVGTADGQVAKWDNALGNWIAGSDNVGEGSATGFEALDEGDGLGWRLIGRNAENYGPIGLNALDASSNGTPSAVVGATGFSATATGEETTASGPRSTAMGYRSRATGSVSLAVGEETEASGEFAVAFGDRTIASEQSSTAFGAGSKATNTHATAMGENTIASGKGATSTGISTRAESLGSFVIGRNNVGGGSAFEWRDDDPLFEIGNGGDLVPDNALTVLKNGRVGIGVYDPKATHHVHADSFESNTRYTTDDSFDGTGDGLYVGLINTLGFGLTGQIMNEEKGPLRFGTYGVNHMMITHDGKVGVGVINPSVKFEVDGEIRSTDLAGSGQRNVMADTNGNLVIGAIGGESSLWSETGDNLFFDGGNVGIGTTEPGMRTGAGKYLTVATGTSPADNAFATIEIQGGQGSVNKPVGHLDFISNASPGNAAIGRVESRTSGGAQFRGDLAFYTKNGPNYGTSSLAERMTIKYDGNIGIGTINPSSKLEVDGDIKTSGEVHSASTGTANMIPIAYGSVDTDGTIVSGSGNFIVQTGSIPGYYSIRITGENYRFDTHTTTATVVNAPGFLTVYTGTGALDLQTKNASGTNTQIPFSFVTYKH